MTDTVSQHMVEATYREATAQDVEGIAVLHADSWRRHYRGAYSDSFLDNEVIPDRNRVWMERLNRPDRSNECTIVAERDCAIVGLAPHNPGRGRPMGRSSGQSACALRPEGQRHRYAAHGGNGKSNPRTESLVRPLPLGTRRQYGGSGVLCGPRRQTRWCQDFRGTRRRHDCRVQIRLAGRLCPTPSRVVGMTTTASRTPSEVAARMTEAASAWLDSLRDDQRAKASLPVRDTDERTS